MRPITWADGFGRWHASVPIGADSENMAKKAIVAELLERSAPHETVESISACVFLETYDYSPNFGEHRITYREV